MRILMEVAAACFGTIAFSLLFGVSRKYYGYCGGIGGAGWLLYTITLSWLTPGGAAFCAAAFVVLLSRFFAVRLACPVTVFLIAGIFPLVPGAGVYYTGYYLVMENLTLAGEYGFSTLKTAVAIVLGISLIFELPGAWFRPRAKRMIK